MDDWKESRKTHRERSRRRTYLRNAVSCGGGCFLLAFLTLVYWIEGTPIPRKAAAYGPALFILFAGLAALNVYRWRHGGEDR